MVYNITLAVALPWAGSAWPVGAGISPAALKAIRDVNEDPGLLPGHELQFVFIDTQCDATIGPAIFEAGEGC